VFDGCLALRRRECERFEDNDRRFRFGLGSV
jgi:hypothetical protein